MITLKYVKETPALIEVEQRLKELTLGYAKEQVKKKPALSLVDGDQEFKGKKAILSYLEEIAGELHTWYYCDC